MRVGSLGIADQLIVSGVNFVLMVTAARALGPPAFGVFALLYTGLLSAQPVQEALLTSPFNVLAVSKHGLEYGRYLSSVVILQIALALMFGGLFSIAGFVAIWFDASFGLMLLAMAFAAMGWQFQECIRRILYTESRFAAVMLNDGITNGIRLAVLIALLLQNSLTGERLFLLLGATWFTGTAIGIWQIRGSLDREFDRAAVRNVAREHWQFGRWLLVTTGVLYVPWYLTAGAMSSVLSTSAYGAYRAFEQLVNGANVPLQALNNLLRPRLARDASNGTRAMWNTMLPIMVVGGVAFAIFAFALIVSQEFMFRLLFGAEYVPFAPAMFLLALTPLAVLQKSVLSVALQASRITRPIFTGAVLSAIVHSIASLLVFPVFGLQAAGAPELLGFTTATLYLAWTWKKHVAKESRQREDPQPKRTPPDSNLSQTGRAVR